MTESQEARTQALQGQCILQVNLSASPSVTEGSYLASCLVLFDCFVSWQGDPGIENTLVDSSSKRRGACPGLCYSQLRGRMEREPAYHEML